MQRLIGYEDHIGGGIVGGLGMFTEMFGAFKPVGRGALGPTSDGIGILGWVGTFPGRFMAVALPGLLA